MFLRNLLFSISSTFVSLIVHIVLILVVPKVVTVEDFGYWQLYLFFSAYVGVLHLGWADGVYLRYSGKYHEQLSRDIISGQFLAFLVVQLILSMVVFMISLSAPLDASRSAVLAGTSACALLANSTLFLVFLLQTTGKIKSSSGIVLLDRLVSGSLVIVFLALGERSIGVLIGADLIGKVFGLVLAVFANRSVLFSSVSSAKVTLREALANISVGARLMFGNLASLLILGVVRLGIERTWDVETFGRVSLALSVSNLVMVFVNATSIVIFPILKRMDVGRRRAVFISMRDFLMVVVLGILVLYFPAKELLAAWLPEYASSLRYMALLFPMVVFEGKMSMILMTYLKVFRRERAIFRVNVGILALSLVCTLISTVVLSNLTLAVGVMVPLLALRSVVAERVVVRELSMEWSRDVFLELAVVAVFVIVAWNFDSLRGMGFYVIAYALYLTIKRRDISKMARQVTAVVRPSP